MVSRWVVRMVSRWVVRMVSRWAGSSSHRQAAPARSLAVGCSRLAPLALRSCPAPPASHIGPRRERCPGERRVGRSVGSGQSVGRGTTHKSDSSSSLLVIRGYRPAAPARRHRTWAHSTGKSHRPGGQRRSGRCPANSIQGFVYLVQVIAGSVLPRVRHAQARAGTRRHAWAGGGLCRLVAGASRAAESGRAESGSVGARGHLVGTRRLWAMWRVAGAG
jgi:hypothetical protein